MQDQGADTLDANLMLGHPADARDYTVAATMLNSLGAGQVSLLTNNPDKVEQLRSYGIDVVERIPLVVGVGDETAIRMYPPPKTKAERMGHQLEGDDLS